MAESEAEGISVNDIEAFLTILQARGVDVAIDMELIRQVRTDMVDGNYHVPAEKVAEAIIEETLWVEKWLF